MAIVKPTVQATPFADAGSKVAPTGGFLTNGFPSLALVTRGFLNWAINKSDNAIEYFMTHGISDWDAAEGGYAVGAMVRLNGDVWVAFGSPTVGVTPSADTTVWAKWLGSPIAASLGLRAEIWAWRNARRQRRWGLNHLGFPGGWIVQWDENWDRTVAGTFGSDLAWSEVHAGGTSAVSIVAPDSSLSPLFPHVSLLSSAATAGNQAYMHRTHPLCMMSASTQISLSAPVLLTAPAGASNNALVIMGLVSLADTPNSVSFGTFLVKGQGDANWVGGSGESIGFTSIVPPSASVWQRMEIQLSGSAVSDDATSRADFLIDGQYVGSVASPISNGNAIVPMFGMQTQTVGSIPTLHVGPVRYRQGMFSGDVF